MTGLPTAHSYGNFPILEPFRLGDGCAGIWGILEVVVGVGSEVEQCEDLHMCLLGSK